MRFDKSENNRDRYNQVGMYFVCQNHEFIHIKYAKPNQLTNFVPNNRAFVISVITEFDCTYLKI
jgi:hypothetical protein